ncbi:MAG: TetR/AcrR family transcriptional regulator [Niabella sp.]
MKDNNTYEFILDQCFKLFLRKNYKDVTIVDIEEATGMSRGAVFYYAKDKNELFRTVVDRFILARQDINNKVVYAGDNSLRAFITSYLKGVADTMGFILKAEVQNILRAYLALIFNGVSYYDGFSQKVTLMLSLEVSVWEKFIKDGIRSGELKDGLDVRTTALNFQSIFYGLAFISSLDDGFDTGQLQKSFKEYYERIRR